MQHETAFLEEQCDRELEAAERARSREARVAHLERALRCAQLAAWTRSTGATGDSGRGFVPNRDA